MFKHKPVFKRAYQRSPLEKVNKAMDNILEHTKLSSFSAAEKSRFKKKFISDGEKFANAFGDKNLSQKELDKVFRSSRQKKILEDWQADRISSLIIKGGTSLSSNYEIAPNSAKLKAEEPKETQKPSRLDMIKQGIKNKDSKVMPVMSKSPNNKTSGEVSQAQQGAPGKQASSSGSGAGVKDAKGVKTQTQLKPWEKNRVPSASGVSSRTYDFPSKDSESDVPQNLEDKTIYEVLKFRTPTENKDIDE